MIIKDIDSKLDRQGIFSFTANTKLEQFFSDNGITALVRMRVTKDGGYEIFNFENEGYDEKEIMEKLSEYHPVVTKDAVMLRIDHPDTTFIDGFRILNKVPSLVMDAVIYNGGYYYVYFRFHSADESQMTSALRSKMVEFDRFAIRYLGKSPGAIETFREISAMLPLTYVEISGSVPPSFMRIFDDPVIMNLGVSWTREMKYMLEDEIRAVYYDKAALLRAKEDWINEISREKRIYETSFTNPIIQYLVSNISDESVVTMGMPQRMDGKTFSLATVVPDIVLPEFYEVIYKAVREFSNWELDIQAVDQFENMEKS